MRFVAPILAFAAAFYVYSANQGAENEFVFLFPLQNVFGDPAVAGERSWQLLILIGTLWLLSDVRAMVQARKAGESQDGGPSEG